jgi:Leu/Phe-tRNA-protein transferase
MSKIERLKPRFTKILNSQRKVEETKMLEKAKVKEKEYLDEIEQKRLSQRGMLR